MSHIIDIPFIDKSVNWYDGDYTIIIGSNGTGKTLLIDSMIQWCETKEYKYAHYDVETALEESHSLINESDDDDIIYTCNLMTTFSLDFADDIAGWAVADGYKREDTDGFMKDARVLRRVLSNCGAGYTRMFVMLIKAIKNASAEYFFLDLPETSLHIMICRKITKFIMSCFRHMKIVIATHSPDVLDGIYMDYTEDDDENVICLPEMSF